MKKDLMCGSKITANGLQLKVIEIIRSCEGTEVILVSKNNFRIMKSEEVNKRFKGVSRVCNLRNPLLNKKIVINGDIRTINSFGSGENGDRITIQQADNEIHYLIDNLTPKFVESETTKYINDLEVKILLAKELLTKNLNIKEECYEKGSK